MFFSYSLTILFVFYFFHKNITAEINDIDVFCEELCQSNTTSESINMSHVGMFAIDEYFKIDYMHSSKWKDEYAQCNGHRQSPININPSRYSKDDLQIWENFDEDPQEMSVINNGHTAQIVGKWKNVPYLQGHEILPYRGKYVFSDVTIHWSKFGKGSEHLLDGIRYDMEMQLVFYKEFNNTDIMEAINRDDHIAIISVLYQLSKEDNDLLKNLIEGVKMITEPRTMKNIPPFPLSNILPLYSEYYVYPGSITIPPCTESVTWLVMHQPCSISHAQLKTFRKLIGNDDEPIITNTRTLGIARY